MVKKLDFLPQIEIKIAKNLAKNADNLISGLNLPDKICLVSDAQIWQTCQKFFEEDFIENCAQLLILENPRPDEKNILTIKNALQDCTLIIAVGSGVISDLCKFVSFQTKIPYIIFASAPSMNGYLSRNASLFVDDHKKTLAATLPHAVFCDLEILQSAPTDMIKAGIGDSLCFYTCHFDWYLSHLILGTKFDKKPFEILQEKMDFLVQNYEKFSLQSEEFLAILIEILLLSGAGMTIAGGSYPASQAEHLIAHAFEMKYGVQAHKILHGLQIATTTLTTAEIQENLVKKDVVKIKDEKFLQKKLTEFFGASIAAKCQEEFWQKMNFDIEKTNSRLQQDWIVMREILKYKILDTKKISEIFRHFQIDFDNNLGLAKHDYQGLVDIARFIRNRFTCLDLEY